MLKFGLKAAAFALAAISLLGGSSSKAAPIVYNIDFSFVDEGGNGPATITGTITTDGTLGQVAWANITGWDLLLQGGGLSGSLTQANSFLGGDTGLAHFTVTDTTFSFDHSQVGTLYFRSSASIVPAWCLDGFSGAGSCAGQNKVGIALGGGGVLLMTHGEEGLVTYSASDVAETPLPGALPLFATGLGAFGLIAYRRRRNQAT